MRCYPVPMQPDFFAVQKLLEQGTEDDLFELCRRAAQETRTRQAIRTLVEEPERGLRTRWPPLLKWIDWRAHRIELQIAAITHLALRSPCEERPRLVEAMVDTVPRPDREAVARRVAAWLEPWEEWILEPTFRTERAQRGTRVPSVLRDELAKDEKLRKLWSIARTEITSRAKSAEIAQELMDHLTHVRPAELAEAHHAVLKAWPGRLGRRIVEGGDRWLDVTVGCPPGQVRSADGALVEPFGMS